MSEWLIDENIPGPGERPNWLKPKFKSVAELAKAYESLEKIKDPEIPETYNLDSIKDKIDINSEPVLDFLNIAKKSKVSEEVVLKAFGTVEAFGKPNIEEKPEELNEEMIAVKNTVSQWIANNFDNELKTSFEKISKNPELLSTMNEIRKQSYKLKNQTPGGSTASETMQVRTLEQVQNEIKANYSKYSSDANYREKVQEEIKRIHGYKENA